MLKIAVSGVNAGHDVNFNVADEAVLFGGSVANVTLSSEMPCLDTIDNSNVTLLVVTLGAGDVHSDVIVPVGVS